MSGHLRSPMLDGVLHGFSTNAGPDGFIGLPDGPMIRVRQVHSADVEVVAKLPPWPEGQAPTADALVTSLRGCMLSIVTADCAPVLLADMAAGVIGAAHAGWRGAANGVLENTVAAMEMLGAQREGIKAAIGPCIAQANYEVDEPFYAQFPASAAAFFAPGKPHHWQFDLSGFVVAQLNRAGVRQVEDLALDTYADENRFFSYRRSTHRNAPTGGRQVSVIGLPF